MRAFISHSSKDGRFAGRVAKALETGRVDVWLDQTNIQIGELLRHQLQSAIKKSQVVVLLWSRSAAASRWVSAEILTAVHTGRFILPCVLDKTRLPLFLAKSLYLDCSRPGAKTLKDLVRHIRDAPRRANQFPPPMIAREPKLREVIANVAKAQARELEAFVKRDLDAAAGVHAIVHNVMRQAEKIWRDDPAILNLGGFHRKNAYMLKHWDAVQAFQPRQDLLLRRAERLFFRSLFLDPNDYSALDGIASVLMLEGDTAAARFFDQRAIDLAASSGIDYTAAKANIALIDRFERPAKVARPTKVAVARVRKRKPASRRPGKTDAHAHLQKGLEAFGAQQYAEALTAFERVLEIEPHSVDGHLWRGSALLYLDRAKEGLQAIERALQLDPGNLEARSARGATLIGFERYEEGLSDLNAVLAVHPGDVQATYNKACALSRLGQAEAALSFLERSVTRDSRFRDVARTDAHLATVREHPTTAARFLTLLGGA